MSPQVYDPLQPWPKAGEWERNQYRCIYLPLQLNVSRNLCFFPNRWLTCKSLPPGILERIADTFADRFRFPWLKGAVKIDISLLPPIILLPVFLHVAALHFFFAVVILISLPVLVLWYYYLTHKKKGQTLFFLSLGLFSLGYMYYVFLQEVVPQGHVGHGQVALLTCGLVLMLVALFRAKRDPGYLCQTNTDKVLRQGSSSIANRNGLENSNELYRAAVTGMVMNSNTEGYSRLLNKEPGRIPEDWCTKCQLLRPARAGHCRICSRCVKRLDHHCVWYVPWDFRLFHLFFLTPFTSKLWFFLSPLAWGSAQCLWLGGLSVSSGLGSKSQYLVLTCFQYMFGNFSSAILKLGDHDKSALRDGKKMLCHQQL